MIIYFMRHIEYRNMNILSFVEQTSKDKTNYFLILHFDTPLKLH